MTLDELVKVGVQILDVLGAGVILVGSLLTAVLAAVAGLKNRDLPARYKQIRQGVGRAILLGLEILVGADIIRTVAEKPTLPAVAILGGIVLIRTFLSFTLQVELEGRWPWQRRSP